MHKRTLASFVCLAVVAGWSGAASAGLFDKLKHSLDAASGAVSEMGTATKQVHESGRKIQDSFSGDEAGGGAPAVPGEAVQTPSSDSGPAPVGMGAGPAATTVAKVGGGAASSGSDGTMMELTGLSYPQLFLFALKHNPHLAKNDTFVTIDYIAAIGPDDPRCKDRKAGYFSRNEVAKRRVQEEAREYFKGVMDKARALPERIQVHYTDKGASLGSYDFERKGITLHPGVVMSLRKLLGETCATQSLYDFYGSSGGYISVASKVDAAGLFIPLSESEAEKLFSEDPLTHVRSTRMDMVLELGPSDRRERGMTLTADVKDVTVFHPVNRDTVWRHWTAEQIAALAAEKQQENSLAGRVAAAAERRKDWNEPVDIRELEIQGAVLGMRLDEASEALIENGYKTNKSRGRYSAQFQKLDGTAQKTVSFETVGGTGNMADAKVVKIYYGQFFKESGATFDADKIEQQVRKVFGAPQGYENRGHRYLKYWSLAPASDDAAFVRRTKKCDQEARDLFKTVVDKRPTNPGWEAGGAQIIVDHCDGSLDDLKEIQRYLTAYSLTIHIDPQLKQIQTTAHWPHPYAAAEIEERQAAAAQEAQQPKAAFEF